MSAEAEIRRRNIGEGDSLGESSLKPDDKGQKPAQESTTAESSDHIDSEEEKLPEEKYVEEMSKTLPQGTNKTPEVLGQALSGLPDR
ncbi:hypothetical protein quinque_002931 [Culex quinquefasciatus]